MDQLQSRDRFPGWWTLLERLFNGGRPLRTALAWGAIAGVAAIALIIVGLAYGIDVVAWVLTGGIAVLATVDIVLRAILPRGLRNYIWIPYSVAQFMPSVDGAPGVTGNGRFFTNSLGLRSDEPFPDRSRTIYVFGGSTVVDFFVDQENAWVQRLQARLNTLPNQPRTWVGNLGRPGATSLHNILIFDGVLAELPRADLLINLVGVNDLQFAIGSSFPREMSMADHLDWAFAERRGSAWFGDTGGRRLLRALRNRQLHSNPRPSITAGDAGLISWRRARQSVPASRLIDELPDLGEALDGYRRNIGELIARARAYGAPMLFLTQPTLWAGEMGQAEADLLFCGGLGPNGTWLENGRYYSPRALAEGMDRFNQTLMQTCADAGMPYFDLASAVPKAARFFFDDMHFSDAGGELVAQLVAQEVARRHGDVSDPRPTSERSRAP